MRLRLARDPQRPLCAPEAAQQRPGAVPIAVVTLAEIPADRTNYILDDEWSGTAFRDAIESTFAWSTGSAAIPAGTVIVFSDLSTTMAASIGTIVQVGTGNRGLAATDEAIFFYLGTDANTPTTFL